MAANSGQSSCRKTALIEPPAPAEELAGGLLRRWSFRPAAIGLAHLVELLFPPSCADCCCELAGAQSGLLLCDACRSALGGDSQPRCRRCGKTMPAGAGDPGTCPSCRKMDFAFDAVRALGDYRGNLRSAALRLKHRGQEPLAAALAELLWRRFGEELAAQAFDAVLNTPMHWRRRLRRRTNSPELLAESLARRLGIEHLPRCLACCRLRQSQDMLTRSQRFANVRGAFDVRRGYQLSGARLLVIDDVMTTGATAGELARVLKRAGAATVWIVVLARSAGDR